uniref:Brd103 n=1 Tax=Arundo donax TaxID=35708 RepID=A0A0A9E9Y8_ARUDO
MVYELLNDPLDHISSFLLALPHHLHHLHLLQLHHLHLPPHHHQHPLHHRHFLFDLLHLALQSFLDHLQILGTDAAFVPVKIF